VADLDATVHGIAKAAATLIGKDGTLAVLREVIGVPGDPLVRLGCKPAVFVG
jgi:hypothetical protein